MSKKMTFDEDLAIKLYQAGKSDSQIGKAVGKSADTIASWRNRRKLPSNVTTSFNSGVHYSKVLDTTQSKHMCQFLFQLFVAGKQAVVAGVKPDVSEFINVYSGRTKSKEEWKRERLWQARERKQVAVGG